ncbi:hypothetical protein E6C27_scaffold137G00730 [Cucumis melo var. makuwa]|uniref:Uncharacterized protein n=1 Tax=Cucumis melo var. makuwa TaxID=1194695 RepID=A0A5A7V4Y7_CUCMM|nr:hypothetical protein E6C27_scaffold137G00730 [Cucumis melo var. makuwa]
MQASSTVIGNDLIDDFRFMSTDRSIPKEIGHKARTNLGVNISYQKTLRAKEHMVKILHGDTVESYVLIPRFFNKLVESNPGTCRALEMDDSGHFKFCFMAFGASIGGGNIVDLLFMLMGHFLKCKFGGILLTASSQDGVTPRKFEAWLEIASFFPRVELLSVDSIEGHNRVSDRNFRLMDVDHGIRRGRTCALRICASFGSTRLICASFGSTRLMCASFGSTRLICASFGSTRLICAFYGTTRLLCKGTTRGRPTRGRKDA